MKKLGFLIGTLGISLNLIAQDGSANYSNNFEKEDLNSIPKEFLVLDGGFAVKADNGNKFLELPGAPLDTYGLLFGPNEKENVAVSAKIYGTGKGRRFPTFGVGLDGVGGYKLRISPGKKQLEIYKGEEVKKAVPYEWQSGKWATLHLQVVKTGAEWSVTGKVWEEGQSESSGTEIAWSDKEEPAAGKASITASPYSGTPIRFDDFVVSKVK